MEMEIDMEKEPKGPGVPRLEVFSMWFDNDPSKIRGYYWDNRFKSVNHIGIQRLCRVFITDGTNVYETYNPLKVDSSYAVIPEQDIAAGFHSSWKKVLWASTGLTPHSGRLSRWKRPIRSGRSSGLRSKRKWQELGLHHTFLQQTGPDGGITPYDYFDVIVHQNTDSPEIEASHLEMFTPNYLKGSYKTGSDVVQYWRGCDSLSYDNPFCFHLSGAFGVLTLSCIVFRDSKLVTVSVKWFMHGIEGENNATTDTYISGKLSVRSDKYNLESVLLETAEKKCITVTHAKSIPLLKSVVALPYYSSFIVEAKLFDPINKSFVEGSALFDFNHFYRDGNSQYTEKKIIDGSGAKIELVVHVKL